MKFPSIKSLAESAGKTIKRFPFELLFALAGTIASTIKTELSDVNRVGENWCLRVMIVGNLGLLLTLSATLLAESRKFGPGKKLLVRVSAAIISLALLFLINPGIRQADYVRFFLLSLGLHLLVAFAAFTKGYEIQGFWQFNKTLFLRFLTSVLYSLVLYGGLSAAIGAMNYLFNFKFEWDTFSILFTWIIGIFSTIFFLAGVPKNFSELNADISYPKSLKIFTQYILIPLASVYVVILLAYEVKIIIEWNLPKGSVSYLILSYAVFGILSLLLVYPIRNREENKWLKTFSRCFYFLMIPLLVLLFVAAGQRLTSYGITEFRYFLIALALWLLFITVYFLFFKKQNIKIIPISLCIVTLLSVYGPQSAFSVSMYSQRNILVTLLKRNNAFKNGKFHPVKNMNHKDDARVSEILDYLVTHHDLNSLQPYMTVDLDAVSDSLSRIKPRYQNSVIIQNSITVENYELRQRKVNWIDEYLGLNKLDYYNNLRNSTNYNFDAENNLVLDIKGYDNMIKRDEEFRSDTMVLTQNGLNIKAMADTAYNLKLYLNKDLLVLDMKKITDSLVKQAGKRANNEDVKLPDDVVTIYRETANYKVSFEITKLNAEGDNGKTSLVSEVNGYYLVKKK